MAREAGVKKKEKGLKVTQFVGRFSPTPQVFIYDFILALSDEIPLTRVCTLERVNETTRKFDCVDVLPVRPENEGGFSTRVRSYFRILRFNRAWGRYLQQQKPQVVHVQFAGNLIPVVSECFRQKIPVVVTLRGYDASARLRDPRWCKAAEAAFSKVSAIAGVSRDILKRVEPIIPPHIPTHVIHTGRSIDQYSPSTVSEEVKTILTVGRLVHKKGHDDAIRAFALLVESGFKGELRIAGDGPELGFLTELVRTLGIERRVKFLGELAAAEVRTEYRTADVFVLPSKTGPNGDMEGIPNALKEAMLSGLPVVSTWHGGIPELVPAEMHDWLVAEGDYVALAARLKLMVEAGRLDRSRWAQINRAAVIAEFDLAGEVASYVRLYEELVAGRDESYSARLLT